MKLVIYKSDGPPVEVEAARIAVTCGKDEFEMYEQGALFVRIEKHDGGLAMQIAMLPSGANAVYLKGGLR